MTNREFNKHKRDIFKTVQISHTPTFKSSMALVFSGAISTFGVYSLIDGAVTGDNLSYALLAFILILIVADTFKRGALSRYYNSIIRHKITSKGKVLKLQLAIFFLALSFMVMFDFIGSFSTANYIEQAYQDYRATSSKEYSLLQDSAKDAQSEKTLYSQELTVWQNSKTEAYQNCNDQWKGWKAKYKAKCKKEWSDNPANAKPTKPNSNTSVSVADYKEMKKGVNDDFLSRNIYNIVLFLSMALTLLLQYTTISEIQNERDEIDEMLSPQLIGTLSDRLMILETNSVEHEAERNELIRTSDKAHKTEERKFEELGEGMKVLSLQKATTARGETLKKIAHNSDTYVPTESSRAGHVANPFYKENAKNETFEGTPHVHNFTTIELLRQFLTALHNTYAPHGVSIAFNETFPTTNKGYAIDDILNLFEDGFNGEKLYIFDPYTEKNIGIIKQSTSNNTNDSIIIKALWKNGAVKEGDKLTPKTDVINTGRRVEVQKLSKIYKTLLSNEMIELRGNKGYYALVSMKTALNTFEYVVG